MLTGDILVISVYTYEIPVDFSMFCGWIPHGLSTDHPANKRFPHCILNGWISQTIVGQRKIMSYPAKTKLHMLPNCEGFLTKSPVYHIEHIFFCRVINGIKKII